jgi:epoxyqueuosine reductase
MATGGALESRLKAQARSLGFDLAGIAALGPVETAAEFDHWLAQGYAGEMEYLARYGDVRHDTRRPEPGMRSAVVVALNYGGTEPDGPIARYARGDDYHELMWRKLDALGEWLHAETGARCRGYVDTGPVLERDLARRAGLGWFGKNTNLLNPTLGSFFFLGALFTDAELATDAPFTSDHCGSCTACLDACPTDAFVEPHVLDATRCISYLTIELRGDIPEPLRAPMGENIYGCDICQSVCPWNEKFSRDVTEPAFAPRPAIAGKDAAGLARDFLTMDDVAYRETFRGSAMKRAKRAGLARNAAVVLGNTGTIEDVPLLNATARDGYPLVQSHAAWALEQIERRSKAAHGINP